MESVEIRKALFDVQQNLIANKNQMNKFGGYKYRSLEDILHAVKPLLAKTGAIVVLQDEMVLIGDRYYIKATASFCIGETLISTSAFAREPLDKKGMGASQITGAASSYARKYAVNGLFAIDDTKDADSLPPDDKPDKPPAKSNKKVSGEQQNVPEKPKKAPAKSNKYACEIMQTMQTNFLDENDLQDNDIIVDKKLLWKDIKIILGFREPSSEADVDLCIETLNPDDYFKIKEEKNEL